MRVPPGLLGLGETSDSQTWGGRRPGGCTGRGRLDIRKFAFEFKK